MTKHVKCRSCGIALSSEYMRLRLAQNEGACVWCGEQSPAVRGSGYAPRELKRALAVWYRTHDLDLASGKEG